MNKACLLAQSQQKLQLDYKTNTLQNCQNIELYGSLTNKELEKPHSSNQVGEVEMQRQQRGAEGCRRVERQRGMKSWSDAERHAEVEWVVPHPRVVDKNWEGYLRSEGSSSQTRLPSSGFQCHEDKSP